jgi:mono/diheme cytochrome c family protein
LHNLAAVETPYGIRRLERAGVWRLDPVTLRLERFFNRHAAGMNCWGVAFDDYGQIFHKSGDRPAGYWSVPGLIPLENPDDYDAIGAIFQTNPKTTALEFIGTAAMPDALQGCAITAGFMGSVMEAFPLTDDGAGFKSGPPVRLLTSKTDAFRPVDVSVGPDGAIYVCDFYNPIIGHYQASYRDPARDHGHGRIWRITAKGRPSVKPPDLAKMDAPALLAQLGSGERWTRNQARRLLGGFPADEVTTALRAWFAAVGDRPENHVREALCVARSHHWPENSGAGEALAKLAASQDFRFRAAAALMAGETPEGRKLLTGTLITDPHPRVRLCAAVALAQGNLSAPVPVAALVAVTAGPAANSLGNAISSTSASAADDKPAFAANSPATAFTAAAALAKARSTETALALAKALDLPRDRFLDYALTQSFRFLLTNGTVAADAISFAKPEHRAFALKAAGGALTEKPAGQVIYETICLNCHQADAKGLPGIYPPLTASPRVNGPPEALAKILLHGLTGPLANFPQNTPVPVPMPPTGLTDQQIADVLTWLRTSFGNQSPAITPDQIRAVRQATSPYQPMWTAREL